MNNGDKPITPMYYDGKPLRETGIFKIDCNGLTKREYFAAMAMQGWIACQHEGFSGSSAEIVARAVECADALLKELEEQN